MQKIAGATLNGIITAAYLHSSRAFRFTNPTHFWPQLLPGCDYTTSNRTTETAAICDTTGRLRKKL